MGKHNDEGEQKRHYLIWMVMKKVSTHPHLSCTWFCTGTQVLGYLIITNWVAPAPEYIHLHLSISFHLKFPH